MNLTRRDFGKLALAAIPGIGGVSSLALHSSVWAQTAKPNRSYIHGVQFGLQPFCYHDLPMNIENRPTLIQRAMRNGFGMMELHATWCEPRFDAPGVSAQAAREKLRQWRVTTPAAYYRNIKRKEFDEAGITIFSYWVGINESYTDAEIDATFIAAKNLGVKGVVGSQGLAVSARLDPLPCKARHLYGLAQP